ncbi:GNAT family N-acetyltransferase [Maricaulis sp.]|uniref:GNAT family N-acetyltransferase n=1 Tax=Maricaulis sp. TaxID=1486257 RepID=UPI0025BEF336|nr:GNAT family N-acetyltransferase [Maricaulis sp.]
MPITVRLAGRDDLDRIDAIEAASFTADRFPRRNLARMLTGGRTRFFLAETEAGKGGYLALSLRRRSRVARVYSLAVDPGSRRQGVAEALFAAARACADTEECRVLRLEVRPSNTAAVKLYERLGFHLRDRRVAYYEDGETALVLEAPIGTESTTLPAEHGPL